MTNIDKSLKDKAIQIKGKDYVLVSDRVLYFNEIYKNGSIQTERIREGDMEVIKATITPDVEQPTRVFTGYSQAIWGDGYINKTSALENAETSAVGRALAMMGIGVIESIASIDEINKTSNPSYQNFNHQTKKNWFNFEDFNEAVNSGVDTKEEMFLFIKEGGYQLSQVAKDALTKYFGTGEMLSKNDFFKK